MRELPPHGRSRQALASRAHDYDDSELNRLSGSAQKDIRIYCDTPVSDHIQTGNRWRTSSPYVSINTPRTDAPHSVGTMIAERENGKWPHIA